MRKKTNSRKDTETKKTSSRPKTAKTTSNPPEHRSRREGEACGLAFLFALEAIAAALVSCAAVLALIDRKALRTLPSATGLDTPRSVALIVPARNEAANIDAWLACAGAQGGATAEIVVVDDDSSDATATVAEAAAELDPRVRVIRCGSPPAGWVGKNWAAYVGSAASHAEWLLFTDADVRMRRGTVAAALETAQTSRLDALSVTATLVCPTLAERIVIPAIAALIATAYPACAINNARSRTALMWGGFMLIRREAYDRMGGHAAVCGNVAEDRALAERLKALGFRIRLYDGSGLVSVRMYSSGAAMWEGWRKNFYDGVRRRPEFAALFVVGVAASTILPLPVLLRLGAVRAVRPLRRLERLLGLTCALTVVTSTGVRALRDPSVGHPRTGSLFGALTAPIAGTYVCAVMTASAWRVISKRGLTWKGRTIP